MFLTKMQWVSMAVVGTAVIALVGGSFASIGEAQDGVGGTEQVRSRQINPADENDEAYIRRVSKDLRGTDPTPAEIYLFVKLSDAKKRDRLVELFAKEMQAREIHYRELIEKKRVELEQLTRELRMAEIQSKVAPEQAQKQLQVKGTPEGALKQFQLKLSPEDAQKQLRYFQARQQLEFEEAERRLQQAEAQRQLQEATRALQIQAEELAKKNARPGGPLDTKPEEKPRAPVKIPPFEVPQKQAEAERQARIAAMRENKAMQEMHQAMVEQFEALRREQREMIQAQKAELEALRQKQQKDLERLKELERKLIGAESKAKPPGSNQ